MRSRDGNHPFSLTISALTLLLFPLALSAGEYLISYRYAVHNAILYNEMLDISKSMRPCSGAPQEFIILDPSEDKNLHTLIQNNHEEFIDFIHKIGINVSHHEQHSSHKSDSDTVLTLRTTCFKVDFNDTFVKISALK
jgi:hypothetical protein